MTNNNKLPVEKNMQPQDIGMHYCNHGQAYSDNCKVLVKDGQRFCQNHQQLCCVCGEPSTCECNHAGQFVCGAPLCDLCEGFVDHTKSSGSWGFLKHGHRRKASSPPITKMVLSDIMEVTP